MSNGYIVKVEKLIPHPNANKLQITYFFGQSVIVDLSVKIGDIGIYFPAGLQLSEEFCDYNHLCNQTSTGEPDTGYIERRTRHIRAINIRGQKSYGIYCDLKSLAFLEIEEKDVAVGQEIAYVGDHELCKKYIPYKPYKPPREHKEKPHIPRGDVAPWLKKHCDTFYLDYNLDKFKAGDQIEITVKMHGTSQRTGYLPVLQGYKSKYRLFNRLANMDPNTVTETVKKMILRARDWSTPIYDWDYISGTKRGILDSYDGGFYGSNEFRKPHAEKFVGKLWKGETVYYEIVGFLPDGTPIMPSASNNLIDADFEKQYGEKTIFSYGCSPTGEKIEYGCDDLSHFALVTPVPQSDLYVYRMTLTNDDGEIIEYPPDFMRWRCEQIGVKYVPVCYQGFLNEPDNWTRPTYDPGAEVEQLAKEYGDGPDPIGKTHLREGVVVRIVNRPTFTAYKYKNFNFQLLAGYTLEEIESWANKANIDETLLSEM